MDLSQEGVRTMIYATGDTHGDISRFSSKVFFEQKELTKDDYVIILGDLSIRCFLFKGAFRA